MFSFIQLPFQLPSFSLPSIAVPASIQRRFIGFVLQKSLGHLVKPGQLDGDKITAQLGSGYVEINDVQLDEQAINMSLEGLPVRLQEGSLGSVAVNLPFQNILTAPLSMTVDGLNLSLILQKSPVSQKRRSAESDDPLADPLAQSVASVAQEFIHEELETSSLRESLVLERNNDGPGYPGDEDDDLATHVPGSLDPFVDDALLGRARIAAERESGAIDDVEGVSVLAQVVERLLARLSFKATNITIRIIHVDRAELVLNLGSISYTTEAKEEPDPNVTPQRILVGEKRTIRIEGIDLSVLDYLRKDNESLMSSHGIYSGFAAPEPTRDSPSPPLQYEDNVEDDEEIDASMTQSMVSLPPAPSLSQSETDSPTSTMYLSAASIRAHTPPPHSPDGSPPATNNLSLGQPSPSTSPATPTIPALDTHSVPKALNQTESSLASCPQPIRIISFGKDAIVITLTTPPPSIRPGVDSPVPSTPLNTSAKAFRSQNLNLSVTLGLITIALQTSHVDMIAGMATFIQAGQSSNHSPPLTKAPESNKSGGTSTAALLASASATGTIRGIQAFIFRSSSPYAPSNAAIQDLFEHPSSSVVRASHIHLHLEGFQIAYTPVVDGIKGSGGIRGGLKDLSVFYISNPNQEDVWVASPLLIIDHLLPSHYDPSVSFAEAHQSIPVVNWTDVASKAISSSRPKRSLWRTKLASQGTTSRAPEEEIALEAVSIRLDSSSGTIHTDIAPIHVFIDTAVITWLLDLSREINFTSTMDNSMDGLEEDNGTLAHTGTSSKPTHTTRQHQSHITTPRAQQTPLPEVDSYDGQEKKRLTDMMLADMEKEKGTLEEENGTHIRFVMIRCEVRYNDPHKKQAQRSGALILDLHEPHVLLCGSQTEFPSSRGNPRARFTEVDVEVNSNDLPLRLVFEWKHALAFYAGPVATKTTPFLCIGAVVASSQLDMTGGNPNEFRRPKVLLHQGEDTERQSSRTRRPGPQFGEPPSSRRSMEIKIPSMLTGLEKATLDGLQFWADDLSRWAEGGLGATTSTSINSSQATSKAPSLLIGSRYFDGRTASSVGEEDLVKSAFEVKVGLDDASIQLQVPRQDGSVRPFGLLASDLRATVKLKPDGRDETVIIATVSDVIVQDTTPEKTLTLLCLASPRRLFTPTTPVVSLRVDSISLSDARAKQSKIQLTLSKFTYTVYPEFSWILDLANFAKAPPGVFEEVIPSERTILSVSIRDGSICVLPPHHPGSLAINIDEVALDTELVSGSPDIFVLLAARSAAVLLLDDREALPPAALQHKEVNRGLEHWLKLGYAPILQITGIQVQARRIGGVAPPRMMIDVSDAIVAVHFCADTIPALASFAADLATMVPSTEAPSQRPSVATIQNQGKRSRRDMSMSVDENAFQRAPDLGPEPDMIEDDLPKNPDFIDASYGPGAGARPMTEEDLEDFEDDYFGGRKTPTQEGVNSVGVVSSVGGETIRMTTSEGIKIIEGYYNNLPPESITSSDHSDAEISLRMRRSRLSLHLHSGYDWVRTRKMIEEEAKAIRRRLEKIRQLLAEGQKPDDSIEKTNALLFNSVYLGLDDDIEDMDEQGLMAAIDENLAEEYETASQESWQSLPIHAPLQRGETKKRRQKTRARSKRAEVEIDVQGLNLEFDKYTEGEALSSRVLATVQELKILDHMKTSTWENFLTSMRTDSRGNRRETESNMVRVELKMVRPVSSLAEEEARLRAKILPIRLHVDQDALDFLKQFFSFRDINGYEPPVAPTASPETFFQHVEIFPVELKLDYKPKRVDYKALKEGKTIELMNFFHFEDAAMTLRRITLTGLTGWARLGDTLNDLWTPDVKANQLADVISGVAPIRSLVNLGTGVADLVLLPVAQYRKDKRVVRGMQKGMAAFIETAGIETLKLGAHLANGTQIILEHAENVLGAGALQDGQGHFGKTITTETMSSPVMRGTSAFGSEHESVGHGGGDPVDDFEEESAAISRFAAQPDDVREGMQTAYKSLSRNLNSAAQTILAVPMEVYEQSGSGGAMRAVVRAVPIAVIRPMIGASEAVRETLLGLRNTIDPGAIQENEDKYKGRG